MFAFLWRKIFGKRMPKSIVGIIGGSGIDQDTSLLQNKRFIDLRETPYGRASDNQAITGEIGGVTVYILARHGKKHDINPSDVNYRANIWTLVKQLNCTHLLVTAACGSLKEGIKPGHVGILDQYIDRTVTFRGRTFYKLCHIPQAKPINSVMQKFIAESCHELGDIKCHEKLTAVAIEGPRYSTLAESRLYQSWGCDVVNMTMVPEVQLAAELGVFYASLILVTDYDCWRSDEDTVTSELVAERMKKLAVVARKIIPRVVKKISAYDWTNETKKMQQMLKDATIIE